MKHLFNTSLFFSVITFFVAHQGFTQILNASEPVSFNTGMYIFDEALQNHRVPSLDFAKAVM